MSNPLREIRKKDATLGSLPVKTLEETRKSIIPRNQLSSAYERRKNNPVEVGNSKKTKNSTKKLTSKKNTTGEATPKSERSEDIESNTEKVKESFTNTLPPRGFTEMGNAYSFKQPISPSSTLPPSSRDGVRTKKNYFVDSLASLCTKTIATNFPDNPIDLEKLIPNEQLRKEVIDNLSVHIPLQISIEKIHDDSYWKRCCEMRWTDGQIGTFLKSDSKNFAQIKSGEIPLTSKIMDSSIEDEILSRLKIPFLGKSINEYTVPPACPTSWKQLYLEQNLQEFLESIQPEQSITQELYILSTQVESQPTEDLQNPDLVSKFHNETIRMKNYLIEQEKQQKIREEMEKNKKLNKNKKKKISTGNESTNDKFNSKSSDIDTNTMTPTSNLPLSPTQTNNPFNHSEDELNSTTYTEQELSSRSLIYIPPVRDESTFELHSNRMKPNLFYYLLHVDPKYLPTQVFRNKLMNIFDGVESTHSSRLSNISSDDDIFTFYDNAVFRSYYKNHNHKNQFAFKNSQFWLQPKNQQIEESSEMIAILDHVKDENARHLQALCALSNDYIKNLELKSFRSHIDMASVLQCLPNLTHLQLSYRVLNAGMSFQIEMCGMKLTDAMNLSISLANPNITPNLISLNLSENLIDDSLLIKLVEGLNENKTIQYLDLSHNRISSIDTLHSYLISNKTLKGLNLCDNSISSSGAALLGDALKNNSTITYLDVKLNRFDDEGGSKFLNSLEYNKTIKYLNLSHNQLRTKATEMLFNVLSKSSIVSLDISGNPLTENCGSKFLEILKSNSSLRFLDCRKSLIQINDLNNIHTQLQLRQLKVE